ncbi:MAG: hypothetical protein JWP56_2402, partial [Aeromicrobium sp.]|nr:hypothetical protein [Aeromicrobium sp.]
MGALLTTGRPGGGATNPGTLPREFLARPAVEV